MIACAGGSTGMAYQTPNDPMDKLLVNALALK